MTDLKALWRSFYKTCFGFCVFFAAVYGLHWLEENGHENVFIAIVLVFIFVAIFINGYFVEKNRSKADE